MARAGAAAAGVIARAFGRELARGVLVLAGSGNNGGDGWVVARALQAAGYRVRVWESAPARTGDAGAERTLAIGAGVELTPALHFDGEGVVVDALLGTGARLPVREDIAVGVRATRHARERGACIAAIDLPTGIDATTGAADARGNVVTAHLTITFGTLKRGHLVARAHCGDVAVVDIGLPPVRGDDFPMLLDTAVAQALLPAVAPDAHKGTKRRVAIVGGAEGMSGAVLLAARGALRTGAGLVKVVVQGPSLPVLQQALPQALAATWPETGADADTLLDWADVIAVGPGLGANAATRALVERLLEGSPRRPVVLDADALNVFAGDPRTLGRLLDGRPALLTPHPAEMMRLAGAPDVMTVLAERFEIGARYAHFVDATVLLKGTPTIVTAPDGRRLVTATGTPALATGGSGDLLTGVTATLLAQLGDALYAGAVGAWAHGRAAELATTQAGTARGLPLDLVGDALPDALLAAWTEEPVHPQYPVVCELPSLATTAAPDGAR